MLAMNRQGPRWVRMFGSCGEMGSEANAYAGMGTTYTLKIATNSCVN